MERLLESNPGLRSHFTKTILFEDYSEVELLAILIGMYEEYDMSLKPEAEEAVKDYLIHLVRRKPDNFANGRDMRNLFESSVLNQANRLAVEGYITDEELGQIEVRDLPERVSGIRVPVVG